MKAYLSALAAMLKDWKKAVPAIILTVARIIYGWSWLDAGIHKFEWLSDDKFMLLTKSKLCMQT